MNKKRRKRSQNGKLFARFGCTNIEYKFGVSLEKFDLDEFKNDVLRLTGESAGDGPVGDGTPTRNPMGADYHIHFNLRWNAKKFDASVEFVPGTSAAEPGYKGPFTEDFMGWLGQFFKNESASADVSAAFSYSIINSDLALPLPIQIMLGGNELEIFGMSMRIPRKPEGVYGAFFTLGGDEVFLGMDSERSVNFQGFSLAKDLEALSSVARLFTRGR